MADSTREARIAEFEVEIGSRLPEDYRSWLAAGPMPRRTEDEIEENTPQDDRGTYQWLLDNLFDLGGDVPMYDLVEAYRSFHDQIPMSMIPLTIEQFGNPFCLVVRGPDVGTVLWVPVDGGSEIRQTAGSFTEFLNLIRVRAAEVRP
jgi:hypothetical protein